MSGMTTSSYNQDFLIDSIGITLEFLSDILHAIQAFGPFETHSEFARNRKITELTLDISKFVEVTTLLSKTIMSRKNRTIPGIKESHINLLFILKAMNQAQMKNDNLALQELIKYELKDNLTQWKIDLIPQIRKLLNT